MTLVITWEVEDGKEEQFEQLTHEIAAYARTFCGHDGVTWLHPQESGGIYHSVLRFTSEQRLQEWMRLPQRLEWLTKVHKIARELSEAPPQITGTETWFSLPEHRVLPPPKWKTTLVTVLGAFPVSLVLNWLITPNVVTWPLPVRAALFPTLLAPILTFLIMPRLSRAFRRWLYPQHAWS
ncbi:antibiotic biosynthesis monooxygenase [Kribbella sp. NBC_01245]|uniref:antibiotic biosynthesis monooxygenase n=1 Tax=Kribbella sp. NBC_01245 TaxID=2903578 RepID=UPI002E2CBA96|nr:antibiotic biosynthesis monooxygenase [Kribbella sp. NBC_01245]